MSRWSHPNLRGNAADNELARLFWGFFPIEGAASLFTYKSGTSISELLHSMKYRNKAGLCQMMGRLMAEDDIIRSVLNDTDVLIPVPLTAKRQHERRYNQSEELCKGIVEVMAQEENTHVISIYTDILQRVKFTDSQTSMTREERADNIRGAFKLTDDSKVIGKHVVIVDDIITTGATVSECLLMLRDVPGIRISVLSLGWTHGI